MLTGNEKVDALKRLRRVEGQIAAIHRMVEEEVYCVDVLNQVSAVQGALNGVARKLIANHMNTCVKKALQKGTAAEREAKVEDLLTIFHRYGKL